MPDKIKAPNPASPDSVIEGLKILTEMEIKLGFGQTGLIAHGLLEVLEMLDQISWSKWMNANIPMLMKILPKEDESDFDIAKTIDAQDAATVMEPPQVFCVGEPMLLCSTIKFLNASEMSIGSSPIIDIPEEAHVLTGQIISGFLHHTEVPKLMLKIACKPRPPMYAF